MTRGQDSIAAIIREVEDSREPLPAQFDALDAGTQRLFHWHAEREGLTDQAYLDATRAERVKAKERNALVDAAVADGIARRRAGYR